MKKIICLLVLILTLGGCYDYYELNELAIVVGIGIDYEDEKYVITYEIISNNVDKESANTKSYTITERNKNFAIATTLTSDAIPKRAYFAHTDLLVLSEVVAKDHMSDILDYLLRNNDLRETLKVVINKNPQKLLSSTSESLAVVSSGINDAIDADKYSGGYILNQNYLNMAREILSFGMDTAISIIDINHDKVDINDLALFDNYSMVDKMPKEDTAIFNLLNNETNNYPITIDFDDKNFANAINGSKIKIDMSQNTINITGSVEAQVLENQPNFNLKDDKVLINIEKEFANKLNHQITDFLTKLQGKGCDILALGQNYYAHTRIKDENLWKQVKINSQVKFNISKKGLIYEVQDAN